MQNKILVTGCILGVLSMSLNALAADSAVQEKERLTIQAQDHLSGLNVEGLKYRLLRYNDEKEKYGMLVEYGTDQEKLPSNGYVNYALDDGGFSVDFLSGDTRKYQISIIEFAEGYKESDWKITFVPADGMPGKEESNITLEPICGTVNIDADEDRIFYLLEYDSSTSSYRYVKQLEEYEDGMYKAEKFFYTQRNEGKYRVDAVTISGETLTVLWSQEFELTGHENQVFNFAAPYESTLLSTVDQVISMN